MHYADIDECLVNNGNCSDECMNDIPYYHCDCPAGGQLAPNNLTCVFNANCTDVGNEIICECLPGYSDVSMGRNLNCTGKRNVAYTLTGSILCFANLLRAFVSVNLQVSQSYD